MNVSEPKSPVLVRRGFSLLVTGTVLLVCGAVLLAYAVVGRSIARDFLREGVKATASIAAIEKRGTIQGGRRMTVRFWDKRTGDSLLGDLRLVPVTDLLPLLAGREREGDEIEVYWRQNDGDWRVAPAKSLHPATRPPELNFALGIAVTAAGTALLGGFALQEARRRERPGNPFIRR